MVDWPAWLGRPIWIYTGTEVTSAVEWKVCVPRASIASSCCAWLGFFYPTGSRWRAPNNHSIKISFNSASFRSAQNGSFPADTLMSGLYYANVCMIFPLWCDARQAHCNHGPFEKRRSPGPGQAMGGRCFSVSSSRPSSAMSIDGRTTTKEWPINKRGCASRKRKLSCSGEVVWGTAWNRELGFARCVRNLDQQVNR